MKKMFLVLVVIAGSVFIAYPAAADDGGAADQTTVSSVAESPAESVEEQAVDQPAPETSAEQVPADNGASAQPGADDSAGKPADDSVSKPADDSAGKLADDSAGTPPKAHTSVKPQAAASKVLAAAAADPKVWVCKYVGSPGTDEHLKPGKNPVEVSSNTTGGATAGQYFDDAQGRSFVVQVGGADPGVGACPDGDADTEVTTEAPIVSTATCSENGALTLPTTPGVLYTVSPNYTGDPGDYDVDATALPGYVLSAISVTHFDITVDPQLTGQNLCPVIANDPGKKVWVCKYVGTPNVDEVLKGGKNPIEVSVNALPGSPANPQVGDDFSDAQERSHVIALSPANPEPTAADCAAPIVPTDISAEAPIADPATCDADGSLELPVTANVLYAVAPVFSGPGDYVVTASVVSNLFTLVGQTVFNVTVDEKLPTADCVTSSGGGGDDPTASDPTTQTPVKENDLLPDTGGLPLWIVLLAGPMTAAGLMMVMRSRPLGMATSGAGMPPYSLMLPAVQKPIKVRRAHASEQRVGFLKAVGKVFAAFGSMLRGGRH